MVLAPGGSFVMEACVLGLLDLGGRARKILVKGLRVGSSSAFITINLLSRIPKTKSITNHSDNYPPFKSICVVSSMRI